MSRNKGQSGQCTREWACTYLSNNVASKLQVICLMSCEIRPRMSSADLNCVDICEVKKLKSL
jgi:hypothetical protein